MIEQRIAKVDLTSVDPSVSSESRSGLVFSKSLMKQRWKAKVTWVQMNNANAKALFAELAAMQGSHGTGFISLPLVNAHTDMTGNVTAVGSYAAGVTTMSVTGGSGKLSAGGTFNIEGHSKLYMIVSHVGSVVSFTPPLRKSIQNATLNYISPTLAVRKTSDDTGWNLVRKNGQLSSEFIEELD